MSLSVSSFPEPHSKLTTKRWYRFNAGGASFMKGIRHIAREQLKGSVARFAQKPSQNSHSTPPPRISVRASGLTIDIIAVPHDDGRPHTSHDTSIPDLNSRPAGESNPRPRGIFVGTGGAASWTVHQPRTRVYSETARAARGGSPSPSPSWQFKIKEMGPVPDLPVVTLTPADAGDSCGSPYGVTHEKEKVLLGGDSNLRRCKTKTALRRTHSNPHLNRRARERHQLPLPPPPPPPSPLPLLSVHIAPMRSGSRPTPSPFLITGPHPWTTPTKPILQRPTTPLRRPTCPSRSNLLPRSRSQPLLRTTTTTTTTSGPASAPVVSLSRSRPGSPARGLLQPWPVSPAETPEVLLETPRTAPETGGAAWERREMGAAEARQRPTRLPYGPR